MGDSSKKSSSEPVHVYLPPDNTPAYRPADGETEFFRQKYRPPFEPVFVTGLRIGEPQSDLEKVALCFALPLFLGKGTVKELAADELSDQQVEAMPADYRNHPAVQRQLNLRGRLRRRFSGSVHWPVPRSKYFAVVSTEPSLRTYGLLAELNYYALPSLTGCCLAVRGDGADEIKLVFKGLPGEPNPLFRFLRDPRQFERVFDCIPDESRNLLSGAWSKSVPDSNVWSVSLPTVEREIASDRVFDLRLPETRDWMLRFFRDPPAAVTNDDLAHGDFLRAYAEQYQIDLSQLRGWIDMIPIVCCQAVGGNALTDLFAAFLRRLGCTGIVYPSARSDHGVHIENGRLIADWGWHFVDFSGVETPTRISPEHVQPMPPLMMPYFHAEISGGKDAGSFTVLGGSLSTRMSLLRQFDEFALQRGGARKRVGQATSPPMASFTWYGRDYRNLSNDVFCVACSATHDFFEVAPRDTCPKCGRSAEISGYKGFPSALMPHLRPVNPGR